MQCETDVRITLAFHLLLLTMLSLGVQTLHTFAAGESLGDVGVRLDSKAAVGMLAVHPTRGFDKGGTAQAGVQRAGSIVRTAHGEVYYLDDGKLPSAYYLGERDSAVRLPSAIGEHGVHFHQGAVVLTGGYFGSCFYRAFAHLLKDLAPMSLSRFRVLMPMDAIYVDDFLNLQQDTVSMTDAEFLGTVTKELHLLKALNINQMGVNGPAAIFAVAQGKTLSQLGLRTKSGQLTFIVRRDGRVIGKKGHGAIQVELDFIDSSHLEQDLEEGASAAR